MSDLKGIIVVTSTLVGVSRRIGWGGHTGGMSVFSTSPPFKVSSNLADCHWMSLEDLGVDDGRNAFCINLMIQYN